MKTFLINIPTQIKQKMQSLDVQSVLTTTSWEVFNDEGVKEVFIFKPEGELLISSSGDVVKASWEYIPANQSLLLTNGDQLTMFKPAFKDNIFLALQKDGTEEYLFMIDEKSKQFKERTLAALCNYFAELEKKQGEVTISTLEERSQLLEKEKIELRMQYANNYPYPFFRSKEKKFILVGSILSIVSVLMAGILNLPLLNLVMFVGIIMILKPCESASDRKTQWVEKELQRRRTHNK